MGYEFTLNKFGDSSFGSVRWCTLEFPISGLRLEIQSIRSFKEGKTHLDPLIIKSLFNKTNVY